ncbi:hypothetical protein P8452_72629 [Trifolium repens]|nr:hypothetical protein P8452_72629 [Trifolium repens]
MANVMKNKLNIAFNKLYQLIAKSPPDQKAELKLYATVNNAKGCENGFKGKSPLTAENNAIIDASVITAAIVRLLF